MHKQTLYTFFMFDMPHVNIDYNVFMRLTKQHIPRLYQAIETEKALPIGVFLFEWVICMFSNILPLELSARLWD